jgi:hypothetical protein
MTVQSARSSFLPMPQANGVEPHAHLSLLFTQLAYAKSIEDVEMLLPWNINAKVTSATIV